MPNDAPPLTGLQPTVTIPGPIQKTAAGWWLYPVRAQPHHTDYAGIVWHGSYITWLEEARVECLRHGGIDFADLVAMGCDLPVAEMGLRYHKPVMMGMAVVVWLRLARKGVRWNFEYEIRSPNGHDLFVTAAVTLVPVDRSTGKVLRRLPAVLQTVLAQMQTIDPP
jgi:acyl-CoA thioester hydrolase